MILRLKLKNSLKIVEIFENVSNKNCIIIKKQN